MGRKLYILLTRFPDRGSKWIQVLSGCRYAHAAIGLDEDLNKFYSFKVKGFITEDVIIGLIQQDTRCCNQYRLSDT